jgi:hypothetical protein
MPTLSCKICQLGTCIWATIFFPLPRETHRCNCLRRLNKWCGSQLHSPQPRSYIPNRKQIEPDYLSPSTVLTMLNYTIFVGGSSFLGLVGNHIKINEVSNWYSLARLAKRKPELSEPQEKSSLADALWWAAEYGHACIVERLFHYNVDLNLVGEVGSLGTSWGVGHENGAVPRAGFLPLTSSYRV